MLNIFFGDMKDVIFNTSVYFKNVYHDEWITAPLSVVMIADVDKSTVIDGGVIDSPILGELVLLSEDGANITDRNYPVCFLSSGKYWVNNHAHVLKTNPGNENMFV